jgi:hypothetical protein
MARSVSWLPRLHEIRRSVENSVRSHYDRADLELLFKVQPRTAGKLLEMLCDLRIGSSHLVERETLQKFLQQVSEEENIAAVCLRQRTAKETVSRKKARSLVRRDLDPVGLTALPDWIRLTPGKLAIDFRTTEQLGEGMLMLARILESDGDEFASRYEPPGQPGLAPEEFADVRVLFEELEAMEVQHGTTPGHQLFYRRVGADA